MIVRTGRFQDAPLAPQNLALQASFEPGLPLEGNQSSEPDLTQRFEARRTELIRVRSEDH